VAGELLIRVLGPVEATVDGRPVVLGAPKRRQLLALLALSPGRPLGTESLIDDLWAGEPPASAVNTLQTYVSQLRQAIAAAGGDARVLERRGNGYLLTTPARLVDALHFEELVRQGRALVGNDPRAGKALLDEALACWRGPAFADLPELPALQPVAVRLEEFRLAALEERAEAQLALGEHAGLVTELEAAVASHPFRERLAGQLALALYRAGRQADALRAITRTRQALAEELGLGLSPSLARLEDAILRQDASLEATSPTAPATPEPGPSGALVPLPKAVHSMDPAQLIGREDELARLEQAWHDAGMPGPRLALISGDAGIGKTSLAAALAHKVHATGATVLWGRCTEEVHAPYEPFVEALRQLGESWPAALVNATTPRHRSALIRLVPNLVLEGTPSEPERLDADAERFLLFDAGASLFASVARSRPLLLVIDDMHWADRSTAMMLRHLVRHGDPGAVLVVATYRPFEVARGHPLTEALAALRRDRRLDEIELGGLARDDVGALAARALRAVDDHRDALVDALHDRTQGNPFFVEELLAELRDVTGEDALAHLRRVVPAGVRDTIARRMARFTPDDERVLATAAVLGPQFRLGLLAAVTDVGQDELLDLADRAVEAGILEEVEGGRADYRFSHALVRETLDASLTSTRRARLHLRAADSLRASGSTDLDGLVRHLFEAAPFADPATTATAALAAARRDLERVGYEEAVHRCEQALNVLSTSDDPSLERLRADVLLTLGTARAAAGDLKGCRKALLDAADKGRALGSYDVIAQAALGLAVEWGPGIGFSLRGMDEDLIARLEEAITVTPAAEHDLRARLFTRLAFARYDAADHSGRVEAAAGAAREAEASGDPLTLAWSVLVRELVDWSPDTIDRRQKALRRCLEVADQEGDVQLRFLALSWLMADDLCRPDRAEFDACVAQLRALAADLGMPRYRWFVALATGAVALLEGRYQDAQAAIDEAEWEGRRVMGDAVMPSATNQMFFLRRDQGRLAEVEPLLAYSVATPSTDVLLRCEHAYCQAWLGRTDEARKALHHLLDEETRSFNYLQLAALGILADLAVELRDVEAAADLRARLEPHAHRHISVGRASSLGHAGRLVGRLATLLGDHDAAARHLQAALDSNTAVGGRPWVARTIAAQAELAEATGHTADARALRARAETLASQLGLVLPA